ncbi:zinc finger protein 525-like [Coccinella septempunctata]|uniref:zinc finger protein 525-like n=1 Tax=Coccinella septempunctata TaxID=41139 RepID=UPI001D097CF0|nr:zinc finger protein 525-like [Coccinella septempunctata]
MLQIVENPNLLSTNLQENLSDYVNAVSRYVPHLPESNNTVLRHSSDIECLALQNNFYSNHNISFDLCKTIEHVGLDTNGSDFLSQNLSNFKEIPKNNDDFETKNCIQTSTRQTGELISVESLRNKLNLIENISHKKIKPKKRFKCSHCDKIFVRRLSLNSHTALHTKSRPFICSECGKSFPIKSELTIHKKIHSAQYQCKICSKTFVVPSKLERHLRIHTNERPFTCDFAKCGKKFSDRSNLFEHKETHKDGRHLKCASCEKCFKTKSQLKSHKLSHNSDVLFTCDICKKSYKYKTTLILHMKKHNGYICPFCDLDCKKLSALVKHRRECNKNRIKTKSCMQLS